MICYCDSKKNMTLITICITVNLLMILYLLFLKIFYFIFHYSNVAIVYLVAGALGFATFENVEYVFINAGGSQVFSESVLINELFVLLIRVLMPIHVICAVLQAINLSLVRTEVKTFGL